jgi:hypothetical protein
MKHMFSAIGPEQVSPHYESLSRSRRGVIFMWLYITVIVSISKMGGWSKNEWLRGMIMHHEYLIAYYMCYGETKHFSYLPGPKFSMFYQVYARYECKQMCLQWTDGVIEQQMRHLVRTKEQIEYVRLMKEYDFIKKRALVNFLTNSRTDVENHFHNRAHSMLTSIERYEQSNMKTLLNSISKSALAKVNSALSDEASSRAIKDAAFQSALTGLRDGVMTYKGDPLMPILTEEINSKVSSFKKLSAQDETKMISLNDAQKKAVVDSDKRDKQAYLSVVPNINHPSIKSHPKFTSFLETIKASSH